MAGACVLPKVAAAGCYIKTLPVGVCTKFGSKTYKMIVKSTYNCTGSSPATSDACYDSLGLLPGEWPDEEDVDIGRWASAAARSATNGVMALAVALVGLAAVL